MWEEVDAPEKTRHDTRDFRSALGCFPTGVCLITALAPDGRRVGLTANSFSSVSLDPPMVLWSLARSATSAPVFRDAEHFAIHVLAAGDAAFSHCVLGGKLAPGRQGRRGHETDADREETRVENARVHGRGSFEKRGD